MRDDIEKKRKRHQRNMAIVVVVLAVVLALVLVSTYGWPFESKPQEEVPIVQQQPATKAGNEIIHSQNTAIVTQPKEEQPINLEWIKPEPIEGIGRDPLRFVKVEPEIIEVIDDPSIQVIEPEKIEPVEEVEPQFNLNGIVYSDRSLVIIGEKLLHKGDIIDGYEIVEIKRDSVIFKKNDKTWIKRIGDVNSDSE